MSEVNTKPQIQTFRQTYRTDLYGVVTREMVACALERIAADLRLPEHPNPENGSSGWAMDPNSRFIISGDCDMREMPETFRVTLHQQL